MTAEKAFKESLKNLNKLNSQKFKIREVLELIKKQTENGNFELNYYNDDEVRNDLRLMGYTVSEMWQEEKWYKDKYMTISWDLSKK